MEQIRTQIVFGAGVVAKIGGFAAQYGGRCIVVASEKTTGRIARERVAPALLKHGIEIFSDTYDFIVAVGGGRVVDAAKLVALQAVNPDVSTEELLNGFKPEKALPIIAVPTMAASGSETNGGFVLTVDGVKRGSSAWAAIPKVAILDPELTLTVPKDLTSYGLVDAYSHVLEGYLHGEKKSTVADAMSEAVMERICAVAERLFDDPSDLDARGEAMLLSNVANDGSLNMGRGKVVWKIHEQAHKMPDIYHGKAVAIAMLEYFKANDGDLYDGLVKWFDRIGIIPMV